MSRALRPAALGLAIAGLLLAPVLIGGAATALETLDSARRSTQAVAAEAAAPPPVVRSPLPESAMLRTRDASAADHALAGRLRAAAARAGILLEQTAPTADTAPITAARIVASGSEAAILAFSRDMEGGMPLVRFAEWRLVKGEGSGAPLRLEARAVAVRGGG